MSGITAESHILTTEELDRFRELIKIFVEEFHEEKFEKISGEYLENLLQRNDFHVLIAVHENKVVGGLTAYEIPIYNKETTELLIYDLGREQTIPTSRYWKNANAIYN